MKLSPIYLICSILFSSSVLAESKNWNADFRYRSERVDIEGQEERFRDRIRARLKFKYKQNGTKFRLGLTTGNGSGTSYNQDLGDTSSTKQVNLYLASIEKSFLANHALIALGKVKNPYRRAGNNQLIFDSDITLEGLQVSCAQSLGNLEFHQTVGSFWMVERSRSEDSKLNGLQLGVASAFEKWTIHLGASVFHFTNTKGQDVFSNPNNSFGNSTTSITDSNGDIETLQYTHDYLVREFQVEVAAQLMLPMSLYYSRIDNTKTSNENIGSIVGVNFGSLKSPIPLKFGIDYREVERDATLGAFTESDFIGGGTNSKGFRYRSRYKFTNGWKIGLTHIEAETAVKDGSGYTRTMLDIIVKI